MLLLYRLEYPTFQASAAAGGPAEEDDEDEDEEEEEEEEEAPVDLSSLVLDRPKHKARGWLTEEFAMLFSLACSDRL
jgi:hypothetical protein